MKRWIAAMLAVLTLGSGRCTGALAAKGKATPTPAPVELDPEPAEDEPEYEAPAPRPVQRTRPATGGKRR